MSNVATLEVDLAAIRANYRLLKEKHARRDAAAVVKANAYGLGVEGVSKALWDEGCREFFVATLAEGIELRAILPEASIGVFDGLFPGEEKEYAQHRLTPVLNDAGQVESFSKARGTRGEGLAIIHVDTGMTRLGLSQSAFEKLCSSLIPHASCLMSHLACSGDPKHPKNAEQLQRFRAAAKLMPGVRTSLCNSSGLFLSPEFHFDAGRPGCALYGGNPSQGKNPMRQVAKLSAPLLQVRTLEQDEDVGYGATYHAKKGSRLAVVAFGYADGWFRSLGNKGFAYVADHKVPIVGRISMDMLTLDLSAIPETRLSPGICAEFINAEQTVDDVAKACDTIPYEIFTRIGRRVKRIYS